MVETAASAKIDLDVNVAELKKQFAAIARDFAALAAKLGTAIPALEGATEQTIKQAQETTKLKSAVTGLLSTWAPGYARLFTDMKNFGMIVLKSYHGIKFLTTKGAQGFKKIAVSTMKIGKVFREGGWKKLPQTLKGLKAPLEGVGAEAGVAEAGALGLIGAAGGLIAVAGIAAFALGSRLGNAMADTQQQGGVASTAVQDFQAHLMNALDILKRTPTQSNIDVVMQLLNADKVSGGLDTIQKAIARMPDQYIVQLMLTAFASGVNPTTVKTWMEQIPAERVSSIILQTEKAMGDAKILKDVLGNYAKTLPSWAAKFEGTNARNDFDKWVGNLLAAYEPIKRLPIMLDLEEKNPGLVADLVKLLPLLGNTAQDAGTQFANLAQQNVNAYGPTQMLQQGFGQVVEQLGRFAGRANPVGKAIYDFGKSQTDAAKNAYDMAKASETVNKALSGTRTNVNNLQAAMATLSADGYKKITKSDLDAAQAVIDHWMNTNKIVVGQSIIPDMMNDIGTVFKTKGKIAADIVESFTNDIIAKLTRVAQTAERALAAINAVKSASASFGGGGGGRSYQSGGIIPDTGTYRLHAGEMVVPSAAMSSFKLPAVGGGASTIVHNTNNTPVNISVNAQVKGDTDLRELARKLSQYVNNEMARRYSTVY